MDVTVRQAHPRRPRRLDAVPAGAWVGGGASLRSHRSRTARFIYYEPFAALDCVDRCAFSSRPNAVRIWSAAGLRGLEAAGTLPEASDACVPGTHVRGSDCIAGAGPSNGKIVGRPQDVVPRETDHRAAAWRCTAAIAAAIRAYQKQGFAEHICSRWRLGLTDASPKDPTPKGRR